ncbi:MAG: hypothetical protein ACREOU_04420 [Candidatus Eiseniibacteriota bacterium]
MQIDEERDEAEIAALLRVLDDPAPAIDAEAIAARARRADTAVARRPGARTTVLRWAAGVLVAAGLAGIAYAIPGSPVREWMTQVLRRPTVPPSTEAPRESGPAARPAGSGIAVSPGANLVLEFVSPQASGSARVSLTSAPDLVVRAVDGTASFTADIDRLVIGNEGSAASYEIEIPQSAPRVEIRVGAIQVFLKEGDVITPAPGAPSPGPYLVPLQKAGP